MQDWAVVVDDRWYVAVAHGALPPAEGLEAAYAIVVEEIATIAAEGATGRICHGRGGAGLEWWPPSRAMKDLPTEAQRKLVRKAMGPC